MLSALRWERFTQATMKRWLFAALFCACLPAFPGEIHDAAFKGDVERVQALLKQDPGLINAKGELLARTPLHIACLVGGRHLRCMSLPWRASAQGEMVKMSDMRRKWGV